MSEPMDPILAGIYGTDDGMQKLASAGHQPKNLYELATALTHEEGQPLEKTAAAQKGVFEELVSFDQSGRAVAHSIFNDLEKAASEGSPEELIEFLGLAQQAAAPSSQREMLEAELRRRAAR